jgi:hypothetical protein
MVRSAVSFKHRAAGRPYEDGVAPPKGGAKHRFLDGERDLRWNFL